MATLNGASALGLPGKIGELAPKAFADLITIPFEGSASEAFEQVIQHRGPVAVSMINGQWAFRPKE